MSNSSTIKLYRLENFDASDNVMWDKLDEWKNNEFTNGRVLVYYNFEYVRLNTEVVITLPLNQSNVADPGYNFVEIINADSSRPFYYWVTNVERRGEDSVRFYLSIDTISTFKDLIANHFTNETKIYRQHKDRFIKRDASNTIFYRKIDRTPEIVGLAKYRKSKEPVAANDKWYLVYANDNENTNTSITAYLVPQIANSNDRIAINSDSSTITYNQQFYTSDFSTDYAYLISARIKFTDDVVYPLATIHNLVVIRTGNGLDIYDVSDNQVLFVRGGVTHFEIQHPGVNNRIYKMNIADYNNLLTKGWQRLPSQIFDATISNNNEGEAFQAGSISGFIRSSTKIVSIIECPYCPLYNVNSIEPNIVSEDYISSNRYWYIKINPETEFLNSIATEVLNEEFSVTLPPQGSRNNLSRSPRYESKLYNSDFYTLKYTYDSFSKEIPLELVETNAQDYLPIITIEYKQSNTLRSDLAFKFHLEQKCVEDYEEYLICNRQNNCALYNSNYLNYMRTGYQFDIKNKNQQNVMNWIGTGLQLGAGALTIAASAATANPISAAAGISLVTGGISSITNNIYNEIKSEQNIEQKKKEAQAQTNSVSVSDDLDLLNWYNGNRLLRIKYEISDVQKAKVYQLLYRCGYACYDVGAPNLNSRQLFNYIEADIDLDTKTRPELIKYYADIRERFKKGVTVLHKNGDLTTYCTKENWETWLV